MESALLQKDNTNKDELYNKGNEGSKLKENGAIVFAEAEEKNQPAIINTPVATKDSRMRTVEPAPAIHLGAEVYGGPEIRDANNEVRIAVID